MKKVKVERDVDIGSFKVGGGNPFFVIAGPCVIESEKTVLTHAEAIKKITDELKIPCIFKSSYDKANRTSLYSYRGPGIKKGLRILKKVKTEFGLPVLSDVHTKEEIKEAQSVLDIIQIPALLSRQTDLIVEAAKTKKPVNVKKGQFLSPRDMINVIQKITSCGNHKILLTERGNIFGYNSLVSDMRSIPIMKSFGYPVVFDASHSVQTPGGKGDKSAGESLFIPCLAKAAAAAGADGIFMEVHLNPAKALCDGTNMLKLNKLKKLLVILKEINEIVKSR
ncbi:MAG: 3-deoxy-8-phosphooctulonate synthase [Candidatus Omnitrophica bacterium]|nr:3-deoxy-8-phosphooctulonate synthase [Candidatus Omnitrophota bacterium]